ncbi:hypothetical protein L493_3443 [Bordetella bronchiseptica 99-R-0433]|nr:hypothetical protein L493_3443 [Bordetella bronchiseptica 99-R-0433]
MRNISNRTPTAQGGGGGSRGPKTGGKRMFGACHECTVQKHSTFDKPRSPCEPCIEFTPRRRRRPGKSFHPLEIARKAASSKGLD